MNGTYNYLDILDNKMKELYPVTDGNVKEEFTPYVTKITNNQLQYTTQGVGGLAMGQIIGESQIPAADAPIQGFRKTYTQQIFSHRTRLTARAYYYLFLAKDGKKITSQLQDHVMNLKDSITHLKNYYVQSIMAQGWATSFAFSPINGFTSSSTTVSTVGADGVAYWTATHPREDGGAAWSNVVLSGTPNPLFSFTALLAARGAHTNKKDARGLPITGSSLDTLVCQKDSQTYFLAKSIQKTLETGKYPSVAMIGASIGLVAPTSLIDNSPTESFKIVTVSPYGATGITSIMWFMFDSSKVTKDTGFLMIESMSPQINQVQDDLGNGDYVATITTYCDFGASDLRFWMASNGTLV